MPIDLPENVVPSSSISIASFKFLPSVPVFGSKKGKDFLSPSLEKFGTRTILGSNQSDVIKKVIIYSLMRLKKSLTLSVHVFLFGR